MTLLGQFALWAAFLIGLWSVVISFSGRWRDRPELAATVIRSVYAILACLVVASISLWKGLVTHDFNIEYVAAYTSRNLPPYYIVSALLGRAEGIAALLGDGAVALREPGTAADLAPLRATSCRMWRA